MKAARHILLVLFTLATFLSLAAPAQAASPGFVIVKWGDTIHSVAARAGTTADALIRANSLPSANFIWAGQRLIVPSSGVAALPNSVIPATVHTVAPGDTMTSIATRYGTTVQVILSANGLADPSFIYVGQRLTIPARTAQSSAFPGKAPAKVANPPTDGKWIDVNLTTQTAAAYLGTDLVKSVLASTGTAVHPTPVGKFAIYSKITSQTMSGGWGADSYYLPGVPWVMYFEDGNALHGTYWHKNFGHPMSHGCVNLNTDDAKWFYDWAEVGTPVISHP